MAVSASARGAKPGMAGPRNAEAKISKPLPMVTTLAYRNLFHDRLSLVVTLVGIVFSVVLVAVLCGLYLGMESRITAMLDHSQADLWVVPLGTKSFDDPALLPGREKYLILSTPGVAGADELVVSFVAWRKPTGGSTVALLVGSDTKNNKSLPWDIVEGSITDLSAPSAIAVDKTYLDELGIKRRGDRAEINNTEVVATVITKGIRSFTTLPYVFTTAATARTLLDAAREQASYMMVRLTPGSDLEQVRKLLRDRLPDAEVLTQYEFRKRSQDYWLFETGAGSAIIAAALLGVVVGIVVVAQTLYASTKEHINEFATLRALGASSGFIRKVILVQAVLSAGMGYVVGIALSLVVIWAFQDTTLLIVMTLDLAIALLVLTMFMCVFAAICAIFKVTRIDPAVVFSR